MGKILSLVLGLVVLSFIAYKVMYGRLPANEDGEPTAPTEQLKGAREAAKRIEDQQQEQADKAFNVSED